MGVDYLKRCMPDFSPYERIETWISVAVGMPVVNWQREIAIDFNLVLGSGVGCPGCHDTYFATGLGKPSAVVFNSEGHSVENRREAVIEKTVVYFIVR